MNCLGSAQERATRGAGMLAVFTAIADLLANPFWTMTGEARFNATNGFFEHIAMIAGFILAALLAEHEQKGAAKAESNRGGGK